jgi:hypothetical protein
MRIVVSQFKLRCKDSSEVVTIGLGGGARPAGPQSGDRVIG